MTDIELLIPCRDCGSKDGKPVCTAKLCEDRLAFDRLVTRLEAAEKSARIDARVIEELIGGFGHMSSDNAAVWVAYYRRLVAEQLEKESR